MNTPSHMILGAALFARKGRAGVTLAAFAGGLVPDLSLLLMVTWSVWVRSDPEQTVFGTLYFTPAWQRVFAVDHSLVLWGGLFAFGSAGRYGALRAFCGAGLVHAATDFLLHRDDARMQLWPLSDYVFRSPVSYWNPAYYGNIVAPVEAGMVIGLTVLLLRSLTRWWERALTLAVAAVLVGPILATGGFHGLHGMG